jgi:1-deoxy-D-xylulose-5-phosphate reductoisomerase
MATATRRLDLASLGRMTFEPPDLERFPALALARQALAAGGAAPTILNAANEVAVQLFLDGRIDFLGIAALVAAALDRLGAPPAPDLEAVLEADAAARRTALALAAGPAFA